MRRRRGAFAEEQIKYSISQCSIWLDLQFCVRWPTYSNLISEILLGFGKPGVSISLLFCHEYILPLSPLSKSKPLFEKLTQFRQVATKCPFAWGGPGGWLRLMRFDNRLIIDFFQKAVCILKWLFLIKKQIQKEKCESPSWKIRYWKCFDQFIVERAAIILDLHLSSESWKTSTRKHLMTQNKENTRYFAKSWVLCDKLVQLITILWTNRVKPINCNYFLLPIDFD